VVVRSHEALELRLSDGCYQLPGSVPKRAVVTSAQLWLFPNPSFMRKLALPSVAPHEVFI
jgi:hypothetical protein